MRAYDETYLPDAMGSLGVMMDYGVNTCGVKDFFERFISSRAALSFGHGHPLYVAGMSGIELAQCVLKESGLLQEEPLPYYADNASPEYWAGWILAYLQWYFCMDFPALAKRGVGMEQLLWWYPTIHEADVSKAVSLAARILEADGESSLKKIRKAAGFTQEELSSRSGVSLRMIRSYEQGAQSLSCAEYRTVRRLAWALGCRTEDFVGVM